MFGLHHPLDILLLCAGVSFGTMLFVMLFNSSFDGWDRRVLQWFSNIAQSPKWFFGWVLIFLAWIPVRELLVEHAHWFAGDGDLIVLTVLWSVAPFMVENAMKYSTAAQMTAIQEQTSHIVAQNDAIVTLTTAVRAQLDRAAEHDDLLHEMVVRLLDAIEQNRAVIDLANMIRSYLTKPNADADAYLRLIVAQLLDEIDKGAQS
ncbi:MAG: hypothetical protein HKL92_03065 [Candidatus Eremiobacteraeota bacterium]|nr:hypothetical protein [Candidatus Eremiobacteraeota bacterium]